MTVSTLDREVARIHSSDTMRLETRTPDSYEAHPLLDPDLLQNRPGLIRLWLGQYRALRSRPGSKGELIARLVSSGETTQAPYQEPEAYLRDTDTYLIDLLRHLPVSIRHDLRPLPETRSTNDLRELFMTCFESSHPRLRYEAQRKLGLAKLLFEIDHCRRVRDGQRHKKLFETLLDDDLLAEAPRSRMVEICCRFVEGEESAGRFDIGVPPSPDTRCWRFQAFRLPGLAGEREIEIFHYRCRFKRDASPVTPVRTEDGFVELGETPDWPGVEGRSGSILSKMIRQGIGDPHFVQDILGAQFIVADREQAYGLERRLLRLLGGPARVRNRIDTLANDHESHRLTQHSAPGFHVLKETVDMLVADPVAATPYLYSVELQIYPLEAYLETIHDSHYSSHTAYKKRQFLLDLLPVLFPTSVYGDHNNGGPDLEH